MVRREHTEDPLERIRERMPVVRSLLDKTDDRAVFEDVTIAVSSHLEPKTGVYIERLRDAGADVVCTPNKTGSVHGDVVEYLEDEPDITVFADKSMSADELNQAHRDVLRRDPDLLLTDGAELLVKLHSEPEFSTEGVIGCAEQTTSGVSRARALEADGMLEVPVFAVNHTPMKHWFDNVHGTGESSLSNIMISTNTITAGRTVVVAGYGYVGRGIAQKARSLGADTVVTEIDARKAIRAHMDGHRVMPMEEASKVGEVFITATGCCRVLRKEHFEKMQDEAMLANVGHSNTEIHLDHLESLSSEKTDKGEGITRYTFPDGRRLDLLSDGELVNLTSPYSQGHPVTVMDSTFAAMLVGGRELVRNSEDYEPAVRQLPSRLDREIADKKAETLEIEIDSLTEFQQEYLQSWDRENIL